jgi:hypothetical protein
LGDGFRGTTSNGNDCSCGDYYIHEKINSSELSGARRRLTLMRNEEKEDKIEVAEGLSDGRVPKCAITAFTASNHGLLKLATS